MQQTREALIEAATELFATQGLDVSLDDLCAKAGYTRGAFYVHFKDRDDLLLVVMQRVGQRALDMLLGPEDADRKEGLADVTRRFLGALVSGDYPLTRDGGLRPYQLLDACARSDEIRNKYLDLCRRSAERLAENISGSQQRSELRSDIAPDQLAFLILVLVVGVHTLYDLEYPIDLPHQVQGLFRLLDIKV